MILLIIGAPGAGKGTQSESLSVKLKIPCISTGKMLREAIAAETSVGVRVKAYTDSGKLVPDDIMIELVKERLSQPDCSKGCILDGFPRTLAQAEALSKTVDIDCVLSLEISDEDIEKRMTGRRVCSLCGATFHVEHNRPKREGACDLCGGELTRRADDEPETVRFRLKTYHESTEPLKGYYAAQGKLKSVTARGSVEETEARCLEALGLP